MNNARPRYITFDCYGTLTNFRMGDMGREIFADRIAPGSMEQVIKDFAAYRLDEVLGAGRTSQDRRRWSVCKCRQDTLARAQTHGRNFECRPHGRNET